MKRSEQINELAQALSKAQSQIKSAFKDRENPFFNSTYTTLDGAWNACREALASNGLSVIQMPSSLDDGRLRLTTVLLHVSGQFFEEELFLTPKDRSPQALGSTITYGRRYSLMGFVGLASQEEKDDSDPGDDDGNAATDTQITSPSTTHHTKQVTMNADAQNNSLESPKCKTCFTEMKLSKSGQFYVCPNYKDESQGKHYTISKQDRQSFGGSVKTNL